MPATSPDLSISLITPPRASPMLSSPDTPTMTAEPIITSPPVPEPALIAPISSSSITLNRNPSAGASSSPPRFEAPPLPRKPGELNYIPPPPGTPPRTPSASQSGSPNSFTTRRSARLLHALSPRSRRVSTGSSSPRKKKLYTVCGLHLTSLAFFIVVVLALPGTVAAWALAAMHFSSAPPGSTSSALSGGTGIGNTGLAAAAELYTNSALAAAEIAQQSPTNMTIGFNTTSANSTSIGRTPTPSNANVTLTTDGGSPSNTSGSMSAMNSASSDSSNTSQAMLLSGVVFLHVAFAIGVLLELLILDRLLYQLVQQRRQHLHPGSVAPSNAGSALGAVLHLRRRRSTDSAGPDSAADAVNDGPQSFLMRYAAPWNRPALPSYRAAIGVRERGTGDVEDEVIVGPAPPEYGNYRGSVLLLQGALRRGASTSSRRSSGSGRNVGETGRRTPAGAEAGEAGLDEDGRRDAELARQLEEALSEVEMPAPPAAVARA